MGQDLFLAIDHRDTAEVERLLKAGADPNSRNGLEFTPLYIAAASHQPEVMSALIKAGATVDAESSYGTPLLFASATGNVPGANMLLSLGANPNTERGDGMTPLMFASGTGVPPLVAEYLQRKVDVNVQDESGATALTLAARGGHDEVVKMLLDGGATVDVTDSNLQTPLMEAAKNGHAKCVDMLLKKGAKVNAKDDKGRTPLILAVSYGDFPDVVRTLKQAGADAKISDAKGRTAPAIAVQRERRSCTSLLGKPSQKALAAVREFGTPKESVQASLKILQSSMLKFAKGVSCVSCHQEGLGRITTGTAKAHGFNLNQEVQKIQGARLGGMLNAMKPLHLGALKDPEVMKQIPLMEINQISSTDTWILSGMAAHGEKRNDAIAAMTAVLAKQQAKEGFWSFSLPRVPMQSSFFTFTALSVQSLRNYAPKSAETSERINRAKAWLQNAPAKNSEDRAFKLLGLMWAGATKQERQTAIDAVRADQHADGGWSQMPGMPSDAYATGQALYALRLAGEVSASDSIYKRGVRYLLKTQDEDGSWFVNKRAIPANNYFDGGFPHGESQYSSFNGTCWATLALLETMPAKATK